MTPRLHLDDAPLPPPDVRNPLVYRKQVALARMIARYIEAMPLREMATIANDARLNAWRRSTDEPARAEMTRDAEVIEALASAQSQLAEIRARAGA